MLQRIQFFFFLLLALVPGFIALFILPSFYIGEANMYLRILGRIAMTYLTVTLMITPISAYISEDSFRKNFIQLRKLFWLAGFCFFLFHAVQYILIEYGYHQFADFITNIIQRPDALSGVIAGSIMLILGLTSNQFSMNILGGKVWKGVQSLAYPVFLLALIHIAFASRFDNFYILLTGVLVTTRTLSYLQHLKPRNPINQTPQWLCVPCGYIYNEAIWDPDSGIAPGTRFEDIPDDWRCPICGVGKADFELIGGNSEKNTTHKSATITKKTYLTEDVIELIITPSAPIISQPGQFVTIGLTDKEGTFNRSYSLVENIGTAITLSIKIKPDGRGGKVITDLKEGDICTVNGAFGEFFLQNTKNIWVFIATGTGLAPIIAQMEANQEKQKILYIGAQTRKNLFYGERLKKIQNLETHIYLSREETEEYNFWRVNTSAFTYPLETEFYICGNPALVTESERILQEKGYTHIFHESF